MSNWAIVHKDTGEVQFVKSLGGIEETEWEINKLSAEPSPLHDYVNGRLQLNTKRKTECDETSRINSLTPIQRQQEAMQKVIEMMEEHGIVPKAAAQSMRKKINGL